MAQGTHQAGKAPLSGHEVPDWQLQCIQSKVEGFAGELPEIDVLSRQAAQPDVL